jgi:O-antigen/teichoic acid export membrane protein
LTSLVSKRFKGITNKKDIKFFTGATLFSGGMVVGRVLGMAFSLVLAAIFTPEEFGSIQYAITLSGVVTVLTEPFGQKVLARYTSKFRDDPVQLNTFLASAWVFFGIIFAVTMVIAIPALLIMANDLALGTIVVFIGFTVFYLYWGLSRGFMAPGRLVVVYLTSNVVQLVMILGVVKIFHIHSPTIALIIYGTSYYLPLFLLERFMPLSTRKVDFKGWSRAMMAEIFKLSWPIFISQVCYMLYSSLDVLLVENFSGRTAVGIYRLAKTLVVLFTFIPQGNNMLLLPEIAAAPKDQHRRLLLRSLYVSTLINVVMLAPFMLLLSPTIHLLYGPKYVLDLPTTFILALGMITMGIYTILTAFYIGVGRPAVETVSRIASLAASALVAVVMIPTYGAYGAAWSTLAGALAALLACLVDRLRKVPPVSDAVMDNEAESAAPLQAPDFDRD